MRGEHTSYIDEAFFTAGAFPSARGTRIIVNIVSFNLWTIPDRGTCLTLLRNWDLPGAIPMHVGNID